jgi:hypothetical protein
VCQEMVDRADRVQHKPAEVSKKCESGTATVYGILHKRLCLRACVIQLRQHVTASHYLRAELRIETLSLIDKNS